MDRKHIISRGILHRRLMVCASCLALLAGTNPEPLHAQAPPVASQAESQKFAVEQLDALLAPIALYPDELLTQVLMASTYPLQVVDASRWSDDPTNKALKGDALIKALASQNWDPSVKSLVPFPQVLAMMNGKLDWMQQLGYAMTVQQKSVLDSVQRLRRQAQAAGKLNTTAQQVVRNEGQTVVIAPAQPNVVYVPSYNPTVVYGAWPYPSYPPVFLPPPPAYPVGTALAAGLAFGTGIAITAGLWGWASPNWGGGYANVNVTHYNNINVNRAQINNPNWRPGGAANRPGGGAFRPPAGPVGAPARPGGLPANGIGRPGISAPGGIVRPPSGMGPGNRPPINPGRPGSGTGVGQGNRPAGQPGGRPPGQANRPGGGQGIGQGNRPGAGQGVGQGGRPATRPPSASQGGGRSPGAFGGIRDGRNAAQFGNRGAQSRQFNTPQRGGGGARAGSGARAGGGRGRGR